jgi:hypothetical protein
MRAIIDGWWPPRQNKKNEWFFRSEPGHNEVAGTAAA